jgi:hypothetical protein
MGPGWTELQRHSDSGFLEEVRGNHAVRQPRTHPAHRVLALVTRNGFRHHADELGFRGFVEIARSSELVMPCPRISSPRSCNFRDIRAVFVGGQHRCFACTLQARCVAGQRVGGRPPGARKKPGILLSHPHSFVQPYATIDFSPGDGPSLRSSAALRELGRTCNRPAATEARSFHIRRHPQQIGSIRRQMGIRRGRADHAIPQAHRRRGELHPLRILPHAAHRVSEARPTSLDTLTLYISCVDGASLAGARLPPSSN